MNLLRVRFGRLFTNKNIRMKILTLPFLFTSPPQIIVECFLDLDDLNGMEINLTRSVDETSNALILLCVPIGRLGKASKKK